MNGPQSWHIVKRPTGSCEIVPSEQAAEDDPENIERWGPFTFQEEAIASRVGLIRSGKCQPV